MGREVKSPLPLLPPGSTKPRRNPRTPSPTPILVEILGEDTPGHVFGGSGLSGLPVGTHPVYAGREDALTPHEHPCGFVQPPHRTPEINPSGDGLAHHLDQIVVPTGRMVHPTIRILSEEIRFVFESRIGLSRSRRNRARNLDTAREKFPAGQIIILFFSVFLYGWDTKLSDTLDEARGVPPVKQD